MNFEIASIMKILQRFLFTLEKEKLFSGSCGSGESKQHDRHYKSGVSMLLREESKTLPLLRPL